MLEACLTICDELEGSVFPRGARRVFLWGHVYVSEAKGIEGDTWQASEIWLQAQPCSSHQPLKSCVRLMARSEGAVFIKDRVSRGTCRVVCVMVTGDRHFISAVYETPLGSLQDGRADRGLSCGPLTPTYRRPRTRGTASRRAGHPTMGR